MGVLHGGHWHSKPCTMTQALVGLQHNVITHRYSALHHNDIYY